MYLNNMHKIERQNIIDIELGYYFLFNVKNRNMKFWCKL